MWRYMNTGYFHIMIVTIAFGLFWLISFNLPQEAGPINECLDMMMTSFKSQQIPDFLSNKSNPCLSVRAPQQILLNLTVPLMLMSRVPQIIQNIQNGHTGILSMITLTMNALGSLARIFTTFQVATGVDNSALLVYSLSFGLNFTLLIQCIIYREGTKQALAKKEN